MVRAVIVTAAVYVVPKTHRVLLVIFLATIIYNQPSRLNSFTKKNMFAEKNAL